jgi:acyl-CoA thioesterase FadM
MIAATRPDLAAVQQNIAYKRELLAGDIVGIRSALVEIRDKSTRFQHEMRKRRRLSHELATDRTGQHQPRLKIGDSGLRAALDRHVELAIN